MKGEEKRENGRKGEEKRGNVRKAGGDRGGSKDAVHCSHLVLWQSKGGEPVVSNPLVVHLTVI